jgi:hypothetical protein
MNAPQDLDRRLDDWMQQGPDRAPERSIAAALDHARAHPRRRDPLAALRRDPMGSRGFGFGSGLRAMPLVAALGLLLVAALAVATVGGLFDGQPVVVPPVTTASPSPAPSATPGASPSAAPSASPVVRTVDLIAFDGRTLSTIEIVDESGTLVDARSGQPAEGGSASSPDAADVVNDPVDPNTIVLTWTGLFDSDDRRLTIAPDGRTMTIEVAQGVGDLLPVDRKLILTFSGPVPAAEVTATIVDVAR